MALPVKNVCTPSSLYGGFEHTLFLGCSVMSFSASAGWNEQASELTVQLVEDTCAPPIGSPKKYYDQSLTKQDWTDPDPGFFGLTTDIIGAPAFFRVGNFEYSGLVQSWEESNSESGNPTYTVKITDPRVILRGTEVIIGEYAGTIGGNSNLFNAFGFLEATGAGACLETYQSSPGVYTSGTGLPDGSIFGSPADKFGGADINNNGLQANQLISAIRVMSSSIPTAGGTFSPSRLVFRSPITSSIPASGMGLVPADLILFSAYYLDLEDLPVAPTYLRIQGANINMLDLISQICEATGHDYYIELIHVVDGALGAGVHKFIKVRTKDRTSAPVLNTLSTFVANKGDRLQSHSSGRELRNENAISFLVGGPKQNFYQAVQSFDPEGDGQPTPPELDNMICPYVGLDPLTGNVIVPTCTEVDFWNFDVSTADLALMLGNAKYAGIVSLPATINIDERELMAASAGYDTWLNYASWDNTDLFNALNLDMSGLANLDALFKVIEDKALAGVDDFAAADFINTGVKNATIEDGEGNGSQVEIAQIAFTWLGKFVSNYGTKWQVRIPFTCGRVDSESGAIQLSEEPSDGGWTEVTPVLGLTHPSTASDFFTLDDGRLGAFGKFENASDNVMANLETNEYVIDTISNNLWLKCDVEPNWVYLDKSTLFSPRAVVTFPEPVGEIDTDVNTSINGLWKHVTTGKKANNPTKIKAAVDKARDNPNMIETLLAYIQRARYPAEVGFGIKSNILKYGAWWDADAIGAVQVDMDEGLVPWEYGGFTDLNTAAGALAESTTTATQVDETGKVRVAGYPEIPLGAELLSAETGNPFAGGAGPNLIENRTASSTSDFGSTHYFVPIAQWDGTYGPNVTSVTTQVGESGITTEYSIRTWTPKFGIFAKTNADRIRQVGKLQLRLQRDFRKWQRQRTKRRQINLLNTAAGTGRKARAARKLLNDAGVLSSAKTPTTVFVGKLGNWNDAAYRRPITGMSSMTELPTEISNNYANKSFMSLDGLIRPVSISGSGGLPRYIQTGSNCQVSTSKGAQPPVDIPGEAGSFNQYNVNHSQSYLNPFSNPNSVLPTNLSDTASHGHDIELLGRGTTVPGSSMQMVVQGVANTADYVTPDYQSDYRTFALRGPLVMQSWGYDLDGFPVPNKADTEVATSGGTFANSGLQSKFMNDWLRKSHTWPVAPVDLRLDRERGVWTIPQYRDLVVRLDEDISSGGSGVATQLSGPQLYTNAGNVISNPKVVIHDDVNHATMSSGDKAIVRYDPYDCKYRILEYKSTSVSGDVFKYRLTQCVPQGFQEASGIRLMWNQQNETWDDGAAVSLWAGECNNRFGPAPSGFCGWARNVAGSGSAAIISMEHMAQYIEFETTQNVGCLDNQCFPSWYRDNGAEVQMAQTGVGYWDGVNPFDVGGGGNIVAVYFGQHLNPSDLDGYDSCMGDLVSYTGIAAFDPETTSASLTGASCNNDSGCGKFAYRVVDLSTETGSPSGLFGVLVTDRCCDGGLGLNNKLAEELTFGTGIGGTSNGTNVTVQSIQRIVDTNDCFNPENYPRATIGQPIDWETIAFGAGLWVTPAGGQGPGPSSVNTSAGCLGVDTDCLYHVQAGVQVVNNSGACNFEGPFTSNRFSNVLDFQGGFRVINGENDCDVLIRGGVEAQSGNFCINQVVFDLEQSQAENIEPTGINHILQFGKGLRIADTFQNDCTIEIGAGIIAEDTDVCYAPTDQSYTDPDPSYLYSDLKFGRGLSSRADDAQTPDRCFLGLDSGFSFFNSTGCFARPVAPSNLNFKNRIYFLNGIMGQDRLGDSCAMDIVAGVSFANTNTCDLNNPVDSSKLVNSIILGKGLHGNTGANPADCGITLNAAIDIAGNPINNLLLDDCLSLTTSQNCGEATLGFKETYGNGTADISQDAVTAITLQCCETGGAIESVEFLSATLQFNNCGQLVNIIQPDTGNPGSAGACPCPTQSQ